MAFTVRYVSDAGAGDNSGSTEENAMTFAQMISDINTPRTGYWYWCKKGIGDWNLGASFTITGDGNTTQPNVIAGYDVTPGDVTFLRGSDGKLDTTHMPSIVFGNGFGLNSSAGNYFQIQGMRFSGNRASPLINVSANEVSVLHCDITNASSDAAAVGLSIPGSNSGTAINNDIYVLNGADGAIALSGGNTILGNRIEAGPNVEGINFGQICAVAKNTIIGGKTGIRKIGTTTMAQIIDNTIVGCSGDGIDCVTATTAKIVIAGNHITGCGGYGIDLNTSTCAKFLVANRMRDNTAGNVNGGDDYVTASSGMDVISDDTDTDDFTDAPGGVYALNSDAAGYHSNIGYLQNIGAVGSLESGVAAVAGGPLINGRLVQ